MKTLVKLGLMSSLAGILTGCTSFLIEREGKPWPGHYADCPVIYQMTRLEAASLLWALSDDSKPPNSCLARYYPKSDKDTAYQTGNRMMAPLYVLSFPIDVSIDTLTLPFSIPAALMAD